MAAIQSYLNNSYFICRHHLIMLTSKETFSGVLFTLHVSASVLLVVKDQEKTGLKRIKALPLCGDFAVFQVKTVLKMSKIITYYLSSYTIIK